jgi:hypothetical protein
LLDLDASSTEKVAEELLDGDGGLGLLGGGLLGRLSFGLGLSNSVTAEYV